MLSYIRLILFQGEDEEKLRMLGNRNQFSNVLYDKIDRRGGNVLHFCVQESLYKGGTFLAEAFPELLAETDKNRDTPLMVAMNSPEQ